VSNGDSRSRRLLLLIFAAVIVVVPVLFMLFWQIAFYGCGASFSMPAEASRDLGSFNAVLALDPIFTGLRATAVHGHEVDITDLNVRTRLNFDDAGLRKRPIWDPNKYLIHPGITDQLRHAWFETYARLHPRAWRGNVVAIDVKDSLGRHIIDISVPECTPL
jgi:hypothetical protein